MISRPASSGSSLSIRCSAASPPPNSSVNSRLKCSLTVSNEVSSRSRASLVEALDALAQPLDGFDQVVAFGGQRRVLGLDLAQLFLGAQIDGAEPLAVAAQLFEVFLDLGERRQFRARLDLGKRRHRMRLDFEHVVDFALDVGKPALGAVHAFLGAGAGLAGAGERFERSLGRAVGLRHHALGGGQRVGGDAAGAFGGFDFVDQRAALFGKQRRRIFELGALGGHFGDAGLDGGDLRGRALLAVLPFVALGQDRLHAAVGEFRLARQRLRFGAHLRGEAAVARRCRCERRRAWFRSRRSAAVRPARRWRSHARLRPRCDRRRGGYGLRSAPICARRGG